MLIEGIAERNEICEERGGGSSHGGLNVRRQASGEVEIKGDGGKVKMRG